MRFVPAVRSEDILHPSERVVYEALAGLGDGYVVLHSFPWLRPMRDLADEPLREGEADFLILHPARGLLVLEVKGGVPMLEGRVWSRGGRAMRDPFEQARRNRYALLDAVEERTKRRLTRSQFVHGDVVVFPHAQYRGPLPVNAEPRVLVDALGVGEMPARVERAFAAWRRAETRLTPSQFAELLDALMPTLRLVRCAGAEIAAEGQRIVQITLDQRATMLGLLASERVLVEGTAGSGKTLLALEFGLTLASRGDRVLLLCFNRNLAAWLHEQARADPRLRAAGDRVEVASFHAFALQLARRAGVEFEVPKQDVQKFWDSEVPLILEQALEVLASRETASLFDAVIVDEAQDFSPDWWVTIESLTRGGRSGRLYAFLDLHQALRGDAHVPPVPLPARFRLTTNCRSTRAIARSAAQFLGVDVSLLPGSPAGECPATRRTASDASEAGVVLAEVRRLLDQGLQARQIALIGPAAWEHSSLARHRKVGDIPLIDDASDWRRGGGVLVTTARAFKGLEADVVVAYGLSGFGLLFTRRDLYVAWTRARHRLVLVCQQGEARAEIEAALAEAGDEPDEGKGAPEPL